MMIEFDPEKDQANIKKHGVSLQFGARVLDDENALTVVDPRRYIDEDRFVTYGMVDGTVWVCVHTDRDDADRIISLRKAQKVENDRYFKTPR
ncbi:MAG: BrnT family toxin [Alphaproteobacteria bacterium]